MEWSKTNPGVWKSDNGFKIMQVGRGRFVCEHATWTYESKSLKDAQSACRAMSMTAWFRMNEAA